MIREYGTTKSGDKVHIITIKNGDIEADILTYGAVINALRVPDSDGDPLDVLLGYETLADYESDGMFIGAAIGRMSNRVENATCKVSGETYNMEVNDGVNNLHSGQFGFHNKVFDVVGDVSESSVSLCLLSPDMEQGLPGNLTVTITYEITDDRALSITYEAETDKDTPVNFTNHSYFNLNGQGSGSIEGHELTLYADGYTPVRDAAAIPTGEIAPVEGTPFDFRVAKPIGRDIGADHEQLGYGGGYDHNFVLSGEAGFKKFARLKGDVSGVIMEGYTDLPGLQLYTGNMMDPVVKGKSTYTTRGGLCLETQYFPNAVNEPGFDIKILKPGEKYTTRTKYQFVTE